MIFKSQQPIEKNGDLGGNRTRDNLIKSHIPFFDKQSLAERQTVKPSMGGQYVTGKVSNHGRLFRRASLTLFCIPWLLVIALLFGCARYKEPDYFYVCAYQECEQYQGQLTGGSKP